MKSSLATMVLLGVSGFPVALGQTVAQPGLVREPFQSSSPALAANYGKLPLSFEANQGQTDPQVRFLSRGQGYSLFLTNSAAVLALSAPVAPNRQLSSAETSKSDVVRMELAGASRDLRVTGDQALPGKTNYFIGNDPGKWRSNVSTYATVKYTGVYPGVDLLYYGNQRQLEYDFVVAAGADPKPVRLRFAGASKLTLDAKGDLLVLAKNGQIAFHKPVIYQIRDGQTKDGQRQPVSGSFKLMAGNTIGFTVGNYDHSRELVIDPVLAYATYLGGSSGEDFVSAIAVDSAGNAYLTGSTASIDFPVNTDAFQTVPKSGATAFVTKLNPSGSALDYSTYLGGSFGEGGVGIAVDEEGDAYVLGNTGSSDFPVTSAAYQKVNHAPSSGHNLSNNLFITKLNPTGSGLLYSTYFGGSVDDFAAAIAIDASGNAFLTGGTSSPDFPVSPTAFQHTIPSQHPYQSSAFVTEMNAEGSDYVYSTFLGGSNGLAGGRGTGIAIDALDDAYVIGSTTSSDFPVTSGAFQRKNKGPHGTPQGTTAFVTKMNPTGSAEIYSTYLGGSGGEYGFGIALNPAGNAFVTGYTASSDFPVTAGANETVWSPSDTSFVTKLNLSGSALIYSTFASGAFGSIAIALDSSGDAYLAAYTGAPAPLTEISPDGSSLVSASTVGVEPFAMAIDTLGNIYLAGLGYQGSSTTAGAFKNSFSAPSPSDDRIGFATKVVFNGATATTISSENNPADFGAPITFSASVKPVAGSHVPAGNLIFVVDGVKSPILPLDGSGDASYSPVDLPVGVHRVIASYIGDPAKYSASSNELTQTVIGQVAEPTFGAIGGTFKAPAIVKIETTTRGASIYYTIDGSNPGTSSNLYSAPFVVSTTTTIKAIAILSGDSPSPIATATFTILPPAIATTTVLASSPNPSTSGQPVTFTATVTAASGPAPTGFVTFKHTAAMIGTAPLIGGVAQLTVSNLDPVDHAVTATYTGNSVDNHSTSAVLWQLVNP